MSPVPLAHRQFTGRHMAVIMMLFFAVVVGVNLTMAVLARQSWTGLVVQNSYVASQRFNADTAKREALLERGYQVGISYADGLIAIVAKDRSGHPLPVTAATLQLGRKLDAGPLAFICAQGRCTTEFTMSPGLWRGDLQITLSGQESWPQAVEILVKE